ncbi:MAG: hypothetical protein AAGA56_23440, partial [Myxococcota bacterium]
IMINNDDPRVSYVELVRPELETPNRVANPTSGNRINKFLLLDDDTVVWTEGPSPTGNSVGPGTLYKSTWNESSFPLAGQFVTDLPITSLVTLATPSRVVSHDRDRDLLYDTDLATGLVTERPVPDADRFNGLIYLGRDGLGTGDALWVRERYAIYRLGLD